MVKNIRNWVIVAALIVSGSVMAQSKVAHIDSQKLLNEMPEMKSAQTQLQKLEQNYRNDLEASFKEYQTKAEAFQKKINALTEAQLKTQQAELEKESRTLETMYVLDSTQGSGVIVADGEDLYSNVKKELGF